MLGLRPPYKGGAKPYTKTPRILRVRADGDGAANRLGCCRGFTDTRFSPARRTGCQNPPVTRDSVAWTGTPPRPQNTPSASGRGARLCEDVALLLLPMHFLDIGS
ncbi:hypothetical protein HPB50_011815 [Hyalomma asiaticum]|uniref:Uncharacterized protein n=1 Tax=Hyalomma asiaticum TaxID=266040 RepID=A0ACB7RTR7_HYAAI|nr:hypothetical protein HPB50_011815 [Hyalomma asiaticum]